MDTDVIKKLDRCLLSGNPILFTGAGFSLGAVNGAGENLPSGYQLKKKLLIDLMGYTEGSKEYEELMENSLSDICTFAESELAPQKLHDYLIATFSECTPEPFHTSVARFPFWKRIYTVNIDDVMENASEKSTLIVQNSEKQFTYTRAKQKEYIKLHGCVRNRSGKLVFSNQQYVDSMLNSTDYRFSCFARDMQVENFVILGTEMDEINLDYYLQLFSSVSDRTSHGQLFFINPNPRLVFKSKVTKVGAQIIEWTTEQFAEHLNKICNSESAKEKDNIIEDFLYVKSKFDIDKNFKGYKSYLYFGQHPDYRDIIFDWDFINPEIESLYNQISASVFNGFGHKLMLALYGKSLSGKTTYLKRLSIKLVKENVAVYDFCGKRFDVKDICGKCESMPYTNIAILFDNASFYYSEIRYLINWFPKNKNLLFITTARTYAHYRKRYCLVAEPWFSEFPITGNTKSDGDSFAADIAKKLDEKGLLGKLKSKSFEDRVNYISRYSDVESCLFSITKGMHFQTRQLNGFYKIKNNLGYGLDFLRQLALIHKMDLPYLPLELVGLIYNSQQQQILKITENFTTYYKESKGISIRDTFMISHLLKGVSHKKINELLKDILVVVSPQVLDGNHTYWNEIASTLMKCKLLRSVLHLRNIDVKNLLTDIKPYYNDDYNYWLQVGLSEQHDSEYELALNHFRQAESMSPNSYTVRNAIARNYLRQANEITDLSEAKPIHDEGVSLMKQLISEREEFQVKAYSTHCLLFERIRFFRRNNIQPEESVLREMYNMLKSIIDKDPEGPMSRHISNVFGKFVVDRKLSNKLPQFHLYDLKYFKGLIENQDVSFYEYLEDFELD